MLDEALARGIADADAGRVTPIDEAFRRIRAEIREGLDSGPAEPLDMDEIKATARQQRKTAP